VFADMLRVLNDLETLEATWRAWLGTYVALGTTPERT
jgi:hypothetical protein